MLYWTVRLLFLCGMASLPAVGQLTAAREPISLNGDWLFQRDGSPASAWKTVTVPSSFQSHEGTNFHGVGWYRKTLPNLQVPKGKRVLLHFQAAATEAEVWLDGQRLGAHLGGWTPFRFDITESLRSQPGKAHEIRVRLDEKVGHNTQGFLPIIAPHFGGLWQDVSLLVVPELYCDDLRLLVTGDPASSQWRIEVPVEGMENPQAAIGRALGQVALSCRALGQTNWTTLHPVAQLSNSTLSVCAPMPQPRLWSIGEPNLYQLKLRLPGKRADELTFRGAFRTIDTFGQEFRLNGKPVSIRGVLNWGYSAPLVAPNPGEDTWRSELQFIQSRGFNLMKFCLWIPPQRYLELADEMGILTWMEYPTWHPNFTPKYLEPLRQEFREFFCYDRNHPSVFLRSLTCETGPSADLKVIQSLYDSAHQLIPNALVEDDSSWIGWNRIHDFYDDHPYGNNHTWISTLTGFNEYILAHGLKPLALGETTSADTWIDRPALLARLGTDRPWWAPAVLDDLPAWTERMQKLAGPGGLDQLGPDSLRYGMLTRKYQIEAFRREIPYGGYVITVLRDVPKCPMGLLDYLNRPKWTPEDWSWQGDTICLLQTEGDRRSFTAGESFRAHLLVSHFGKEPIQDGELEVTLQNADGKTIDHAAQSHVERKPGTLASLLDLDWPLPSVQAPERLSVHATFKSPQGEWHNDWQIWVVPQSHDSFKSLQVHSSVAPDLAAELFPGAPAFDPANPAPVVVASHFDTPLADFLDQGGRVLLLPDGQRHSFPLRAHWFLRGGPYIPDSSISKQVPRDLLLDLQQFDLASDVIPDLPHLESFDPFFLLWDTHDQTTIKTHGLAFETQVGQGRLLVSALRHRGPHNAAGRWLLTTFLEHLRSGTPPHHALPPDVWAYAKAKLSSDQFSLVSSNWLFKPDPQDQGLDQDWASPNLNSDASWKPIHIANYWESQGYPNLDHWAWYRLWVQIPQNWAGRDVFLSFEGVDDIYELYVNGHFAGKGGDLATHKDALGEKKSHNISSFVQAGQRALIAVRVHDWYGAGGIYKPVTLGTLAFNPQLDLLK